MITLFSGVKINILLGTKRKIERFFGENFMRQVSNEYLTISSSICTRAQKGHLKSIHLSVYEVI